MQVLKSVGQRIPRAEQFGGRIFSDFSSLSLGNIRSGKSDGIMAGRAKAQEPSDLCCYVVETTEAGVKTEVIQLVEKCIQDKIFSLSPDCLGLVRDDRLSSIEYSNVDWNVLRQVESAEFREGRIELDEFKPDPMAVISSVIESILTQSLEDAYRSRKILFFGNFTTELKERDVKKMLKKLQDEQMAITIVVPDKVDQTDVQKENVKMLNDILGEFPDTATILTLKEATVRLFNLATKKPVRPSPWSYDLEIGPDLKIPVATYLCVRKNKPQEMKQALIKEVQKLPGGNAQPSQNDMQMVPANQTQNPSTSNSVRVVELQSKVAQKEQFWKQNDGTEVDEDDIVEGYYYGDKLVPFDAIEKDNQYKTGDKCLKVLLFCPREAITPCHLVGEGHDLIFPKKNAVDAEMSYLALMQAMINTDRIAIARKVRTTNAKVVLGAIVPCLNRKCLIFVEICFADDVSIPSFAPLIKPPETGTEEILDEKDSLMDEFIKRRTIKNFVPTEGPVDPAVSNMRDTISRKYVGQSTLDTSSSITKDGIDLYFEELVQGTDEDLLRKLKDSFPIKEIVEKGSDRPSGQQIFRKRTRELEGVENAGAEGDKKTKTEDEAAEPDPAVKAEMDAAADMFDPDNLLDDM